MLIFFRKYYQDLIIIKVFRNKVIIYIVLFLIYNYIQTK